MLPKTADIIVIGGGVIGTSIFEYISPEYHDVARQALERAFQTGRGETYEV